MADDRIDDTRDELLDFDEAEAEPEDRARLKRQAVVIVHGMGEQKPMDTIRSFVKAVWNDDLSLVPFYNRRIDPETGAVINKSWVTPDKHISSHELRRITTPADINKRMTDFYEIYWADITQGTTRGRLYAWISTLLLRRWRDVPKDTWPLYWATLAFVVLLVGATVALAASSLSSVVGATAAAIIVAASSALFWAVDRFVLPYFGDVAAYVRAEAGTVEKRAKVRERGLELLRSLSKDDQVDRIVLVSHSLGSIIAYDLLQILWADLRPRTMEKVKHGDLFQAVRAVERFSAKRVMKRRSWSVEMRACFREAQWRLYEQLRTFKSSKEMSATWKISDFITLGSPLTHAEFLITHNLDRWMLGVEERLFAICPALSDSNMTRRIHFESGRNEETGRPTFGLHHGAAFAATRWTNIFDIGNLLSTGDPISGSMAENFGPGVENIQVALTKLNSRIFTHTHYWARNAFGYEVLPDGSKGRLNTIVLRDAVDLRRRLE
jgi:hypothetical protein